jgi:D-cysteine desulfhydrase
VRAVERILEPFAGRARPGVPPRLRLATGFGGRYGVASIASLAAVTAASAWGLTLDPIYTGKVMAALLADARAGRLHGRRVLFLHTHNGVDLRPLIGCDPHAEREAPLRRIV